MNEPAAVELTSASAAALQTFFASGVLLVCVALCGLSGLRTKLFRSILSFASLIIAAVAAFAWCDGAGRVLGACGVPQAWALVAGYAAVLGCVLSFMGVVLFFTVRSDVMTYFPILDRVGGLLVGIAGGVFLASVVRVGFAMTPFSAAARPAPQQMELDVTPRVLRMVSRILSSDTEFRNAWLRGSGSPSAGGVPDAGTVTLSEPFIDLNSNGAFDSEEPFLDKNGDGRFTAIFRENNDQYDRALRVGVMDRYWLGNWRLVTVEESIAGARQGNAAPADR